MNQVSGPSTEENSLQAEKVANYLKDNPGFFNEFSEVLLEIEIPHNNGDAISLFDRQLTVLRDENRRLKGTLNDVIENARSNESLIKRIHGLVLQLMEVTGPHAIFSTLNLQLCEHFRSDRVAVLIFAQPSFVESDVPEEFVGGEDPRRAVFSIVTESSDPICGPNDPAYCDALWPETDISGSLALLPLKGGAWDGIVAIQSDEETRFEKDMGTEFLSYISDIVSLIVDPWVSRDNAK